MATADDQDIIMLAHRLASRKRRPPALGAPTKEPP
jgi:hypothetical protein